VREKLRNKRNKIAEDFYPFSRRSIVVELVTAGITPWKISSGESNRFVFVFGEPEENEAES
jgi:hypothetical protein